MRIAVAVASASASPKAFVVLRGIEMSIDKAARMGYDGIELALKTPDEIDPSQYMISNIELAKKSASLTIRWSQVRSCLFDRILLKLTLNITCI